MLNFGKIIGKLVKSSSQRELEQLNTIVEKINGFEAKVKKITSEDFVSKTSEFRTKVKNGTPIDNLMPEAFAYVREAARLSLIHI